MSLLSLIISVAALALAYVAYTKSGGSTEDMKRKIEELHLTTEGLRSKLADALEKAERKIRGEEKKPECPAELKGDTTQDTAGQEPTQLH